MELRWGWHRVGGKNDCSGIAQPDHGSLNECASGLDDSTSETWYQQPGARRGLHLVVRARPQPGANLRFPGRGDHRRGRALARDDRSGRSRRIPAVVLQDPNAQRGPCGVVHSSDLLRIRTLHEGPAVHRIDHPAPHGTGWDSQHLPDLLDCKKTCGHSQSGIRRRRNAGIGAGAFHPEPLRIGLSLSVAVRPGLVLVPVAFHRARVAGDVVHRHGLSRCRRFQLHLLCADDAVVLAHHAGLAAQHGHDSSGEPAWQSPGLPSRSYRWQSGSSTIPPLWPRRRPVTTFTTPAPSAFSKGFAPTSAFQISIGWPPCIGASSTPASCFSLAIRTSCFRRARPVCSRLPSPLCYQSGRGTSSGVDSPRHT